MCLDRTRQKYFASANALDAHCKYVSEPVKLQLFESYCLPVLLYGVDCILYISKQQMHELNVCWNNAYRKMFGFKISESVKELIYFMQRIDYRKLHHLRRLIFLHKLASLQHDVISNMLPLRLTSDDVVELYYTYDIARSFKPNLINRTVFAMFQDYVLCSISFFFSFLDLVK